MVNWEARCETYKHIKRVNEYIIKFAQELLNRGIKHDASKLVEPEASIFEGITEKLAKTKYNSQEYKEQLKELGPALAHHHANNSHHPEYYKDGIRGMNLFDLVEYFLDCKAASERQMDGNINKSVEANQEKHGYSDDIKSILKNTILVTNNWNG